jgi:hypothetical protein
MSFGFGMILGPTAGGAMFQAGGFPLPFGVLGGCLLVQVASWFYILSLKSPLFLESASHSFNETSTSSFDI